MVQTRLRMLNKNSSRQRLTVQKIAVGASLKATRARPKSQIFNLQSAFASTFFGFKSRWKTLAASSEQGTGESEVKERSLNKE